MIEKRPDTDFALDETNKQVEEMAGKLAPTGAFPISEQVIEAEVDQSQADKVREGLPMMYTPDQELVLLRNRVEMLEAAVKELQNAISNLDHRTIGMIRLGGA